jgi:hypothetical protein
MRRRWAYRIGWYWNGTDMHILLLDGLLMWRGDVIFYLSFLDNLPPRLR